MPRLPLFKEFFKGKTTLTLTNECLTHKKSGISSLSKFKLATRTRYRTVSTAFHNKTTSTESTNEDVTTNNFDLPRCLPTVDNIGTSLELNFDQQESQSSNQASALGPILSKSTEAEFSHIYGIHESDPALSQAQNQSGEDAEGQRFPSKLRKVDAQRLCSIVLLPQESSQAFTPDRASSVDTSTRCTAVPAVVTLPQTPSTEESVEEVCESDEVTVTPASTVVVVHTSSDTSLGNNNSGVISALDEKMPRLPMVQGRTSLPEVEVKSLDYARHNIYHAPTAINGQQALLDFADVHASAVTPVACMEAGRTNVELSEDISGVSASPYPDADISEIGDQCLSLANNVKGHPPKIRQLEPHSKLGSPTSLENNIGRSTENISESDSHLSVSEDIVTTLEARVRELEQQNQDLEAETGLSNENKELITKVYDRKLEELEVERNKLLLSNRSLDYSNRQTQIFLAEEQKRSRSDLEFKDSHIQLLYVDREALQSKVDELLSKVSEISDAASRQPSLSSNDMSAKDEELAEARVKIGALDSTATELQAKLQELQAKQEVTESALREAQTEAWTKKHLHEELCRTLELSKQMHKEANESNRDLALKLARLEALYKMSRQVSERLLADSWQASATKDERIRILSITAPVPELVQRLDDKQSELHNVECRLIATQRLVETLYNQVKDAKAKHTDIEIENQKLECQLGEAKVRLDHDYQEEERLKAELENATAELEQSRKDGDNWQRLAIESLDDYTPNSVEQVKDATLATMQKKIDEFEHQNKELSGYNATLETCLNDLEYELLINEKRLTMDESIKIDFYERHWRTVEEVFVDNKLKSAMIKGLEARFSEDLAKEPLAQPEVSSETFEEHVGPEFIDRTNAFYRLIGEAQEDLEKMTPVAPILTHRKS